MSTQASEKEFCTMQDVMATVGLKHSAVYQHRKNLNARDNTFPQKGLLDRAQAKRLIDYIELVRKKAFKNNTENKRKINGKRRATTH